MICYTVRFIVDVKVNGADIKFEVDSGSQIMILPVTVLEKRNVDLKLELTSAKFRSYTKRIFYPKDVSKVKAEFQKKSAILELYAIDEEYMPVFGRDWIRHLGINLKDIDRRMQSHNSHNYDIRQVSADSAVMHVITKNAEIFQPVVGIILHESGNTELRSNVKPVFM